MERGLLGLQTSKQHIWKFKYVAIEKLLNKQPVTQLHHTVDTYQDNKHHKDDHGNNTSERNKVVREWESKLRLEDHIGPEEKKYNFNFKHYN